MPVDGRSVRRAIAGDGVAGDGEQRGSGDDGAPIFRTAQAQFVGAGRTTLGDGRQVADQQQDRRIAVDRLAGTPAVVNARVQGMERSGQGAERVRGKRLVVAVVGVVEHDRIS